MPRRLPRLPMTALLLGATVPLAGSALLTSAPAEAATSGVYTVHQILSGTTLTHTFTPAGTSVSMKEPLSKPDDITRLGEDIFVAFQNGVGPQGQPSDDGNLDSTIVEINTNGDPLAQWDVEGKADGLTADPYAGTIIATVNEDANSSLYTVDPYASPGDQVIHYEYSETLPHGGGTDAISIYKGQILISASAPGTSGPAAPQPTYPAVYAVRLDPFTAVATVTELFGDEASARVANTNSVERGQTVQLALTDPDSNEVVPPGVRFAGDFMLTSQGDLEQIYLHDAGKIHQLAVLSLSQSVDDTAWTPVAKGTLYSTDSTNDAVDTVTGPFSPTDPMVVATPCGANSAPAICPAPGYRANFLAVLDPADGKVTPVQTEGAAYTPQGGLLFIP